MYSETLCDLSEYISCGCGCVGGSGGDVDSSLSRVASSDVVSVSTPVKRSYVYLTADSPNVISSIPDDLCGTVYVIGGIVDRNRLRMATYDRAVRMGMMHGRLDLDKFEGLKGTKVLTVNQVFEIVVGGGGRMAVGGALRGRKGGGTRDKGRFT